MANDLPIASIRAEFSAALSRAPVVISSPTGSGKSTEVPRWCAATYDGAVAQAPRNVLVVEPRRIACRSLALRVAELEGTQLGHGVGYVVRDERVVSDATRIVFATPGMVLRDRRLLAQAHTIILDEFHERSLELDLLLALLLARRRAGNDAWALVIMSATLEGERLAAHSKGVQLSAAGVSFPVDVRHVSTHHGVPNADDLPGRLRSALSAAANDPGDVLVFLPGKAEIDACAQSVRGLPFTTLRLHGGLSLDEQRRAFEATPQRKLILATNVAETSLTIPGVGVVIDSGLVRQTRYQAGRGFLALVPIAEDSAVQRAGRAGRTAPGVCYRLWSPSARLEKITLPELQRESLVPLVLGAAAWNVRVEDLPWLDVPKPYALEAARADLEAWHALSPSGELSAEGQGLYALPVTPLQARLLMQARAQGERCLEDMIDLVSVLSVGRPLFTRGADDDARASGSDDPRESGCDVTAIIQTLRADEPQPGSVRFVLEEARRNRKRLRRLQALPDTALVPRSIDRDALVRAALAADPRMAHVARSRGRDLYFSNGGTEIELARESAVRQLREREGSAAAKAANIEALIVFDTHALGSGREARVLITCGMAVPLAALARAGLGTDRVANVKLERNHVLCGVERVYAQRVIAERFETPSGALLRQALTALLARGSLFREAVATTRERLVRAALADQLAARKAGSAAVPAPAVTLESWLLARVEALGVESDDDLPLLSAQDFLAPELPYELSRSLDQDFPSSVNVGDASYRAEYDLTRNQVLLHLVKGNRTTPPPLAYLPRFPGLRICVEGPRGLSVLRERG